jgi:hypothetical protein
LVTIAVSSLTAIILVRDNAPAFIVWHCDLRATGMITARPESAIPIQSYQRAESSHSQLMSFLRPERDWSLRRRHHVQASSLAGQRPVAQHVEGTVNDESH